MESRPAAAMLRRGRRRPAPAPQISMPRDAAPRIRSRPRARSGTAPPPRSLCTPSRQSRRRRSRQGVASTRARHSARPRLAASTNVVIERSKMPAAQAIASTWNGDARNSAPANAEVCRGNPRRAAQTNTSHAFSPCNAAFRMCSAAGPAAAGSTASIAHQAASGNGLTNSHDPSMNAPSRARRSSTKSSDSKPMPRTGALRSRAAGDG